MQNSVGMYLRICNMSISRGEQPMTEAYLIHQQSRQQIRKVQATRVENQLHLQPPTTQERLHLQSPPTRITVISLDLIKLLLCQFL